MGFSACSRVPRSICADAEGSYALADSTEQAHELRRFDGVAGKDRAGVGDAEMSDDDLAEDRSKIGRDGEVPAFVAPSGGEPRPCAVHAAAVHTSADDQHRV